MTRSKLVCLIRRLVRRSSAQPVGPEWRWLGALRQKAQEMAGEDASELVASFGQMGRRRFQLAG